MMLSKPSLSKARSGLTLLELVVVLTILAALGGMVVPLIRGYQDQTSDAASIDSIRELTKIISEYQVETGLYPDLLDSLIEDNTLFSKLPGSPPGNGDLLTLELTQSQATALGNKGITRLLDANGAVDQSATFQATLLPPRLLAASGAVAGVNADAVYRQLGKVAAAQPDGNGNPVANVFVVFGFGRHADLIGSRMSESPFRVPNIGTPNSVYSRYGLVFEVPGPTAVGQRVEFVGAIAFDAHVESDGTPVGIRGMQSLAEQFYKPR